MRTGCALLLLLLACACGDGHRPTDPPRVQFPAEPEEALAWVQEVEDDDEQLRARLDAWPVGSEDFAYADETQIAWTWRLQLALRDGDVERAGELRAMLLERFGGRGQYPEGRDLGIDAVRLGVLEEALLTARRRIGGLRPDPRGARSALEVAGRMLLPEDAEEHVRLRGTQAWVSAGRAQDVLAALGSEAPISEQVHATLVVVADDFTLGEGVFFEVLKQWGERHGDQPFDRLVIPLLRGRVRIGLRLVPAESEEAELQSIARRCGAAGLAREAALPVKSLAALGLVEGEAALLLADGEGRIVARLCGRNPDPRVLEPAVQRLLSR